MLTLRYQLVDKTIIIVFGTSLKALHYILSIFSSTWRCINVMAYACFVFIIVKSFKYSPSLTSVILVEREVIHAAVIDTLNSYFTL